MKTCEMASKWLTTEDGDPDGPYDCGKPAVCRFGHTEEDAFPVCAEDREYCLTDSDMGKEFPLRRTTLRKKTIEKARTLQPFTIDEVDEIQEVMDFGHNWIFIAICEQLRTLLKKEEKSNG